jgi:hypothetical protein
MSTINDLVLDIKDDNRNIEIAEYLAKEICSKSIIYGENRGFTQSSTEIHANSSYVEAIHEIAHWIACDPNHRDEDNLGLPDEDTLDIDDVNVAKETVKHDPLLKRMYEEESVSLCVTKYLFDKYCLEPTDAELKYVEYLYGEQNWTSKICDVSLYDINKKAINLFEQYTANIE